MTTLRWIMILTLFAGCRSTPRPQAGVVYQTSTINALLEGAYDGGLTCEELLDHGDFGLGTFDRLDGEMVVLDGVVYRVRSDGRAERVPGDETTPLAVVCFFEPAVTNELNDASITDMASLSSRLDEMLVSRNVPHAIRIDGEFALVRTRSVPEQDKPYARLVDVVAHQSTFELTNTRGTLVGFWFPPYAGQFNVPGYHFHYLTEDRTAGGHVLELRPTRVRVQVQESSALHVHFPATESFRTAPLGQELGEELERVEQ